MQQSKTNHAVGHDHHLISQAEATPRPWQAMMSWVRRHRWAMLVALVLVFLSLLPAPTQPLPVPSSQGMGGIAAPAEQRGNPVPGPVPGSVPGPVQGPPGQYCNTLVPVMHHFGLNVQDAGKGQIRIPASGSTIINAHSPTIVITPYLAQLPAPDPTKDLTYNPQTQQVCASNARGTEALIQFLTDTLASIGHAIATQTINQVEAESSFNHMVLSAITNFFDTFWRDSVGFLQAQITTIGFIWITPPDLTYRNTVVLDGANWALEALDGYVALLLIVGGYQLLLNRGLGLEERASVMGVALRVAFTAVIANTGFFLFLPGVIDLTNSMSMGIMAAMLHSAGGDVSLPLGAINWVEQPITWGLFILIDFLVSLFFIAVQAVRLAVLDLTIVLSPLWIMALANEYSRSWGKLGATTFFSALLVQPIQVTCVSLGSALIANFGSLNPVEPAICQNVPAAARATCIAQLGNTYLSNSMNLVVLILGISTLYVAVKLPGMFFSSAIRASVGSVNRDIGKVASTAMRFMLFQKNVGA